MAQVWKNYYNNEFIPALENLEEKRKHIKSREEVCNLYIELFNKTCELIKLYLMYNGIFQFEKREIIREAFYIEMINDGDIWINALSLVEGSEIKGNKAFESLIISYCRDEFFHIFEDLNTQFAILEVKND